MRKIEERLAELQEQHDELIKSYESLKIEYSIAKQDLEIFRSGHSVLESLSPVATSFFGSREGKEHYIRRSNLLQVSMTSFCNDQEEQKGRESISWLGKI